MTAEEIISTFAQWPIVGLVCYAAYKLYREKQAEIKEVRAECAEERKASNEKHDALLREMMNREIGVRDRERDMALKVVTDSTVATVNHTQAIAGFGATITDMTKQVVRQTDAIVDQTQVLASRKQSSGNLPKVP